MIDFITAEPNHPTDSGIINYLKSKSVQFDVLDPEKDFDLLDARYSSSENNKNLVLIKPTSQKVVEICKILDKYEIKTINSTENTILFKNRVALEAKLKALLSEEKRNFANIRLPKSWYLLTAQDFGESDRQDFVDNLKKDLNPYLPLVLKFPLNHIGFHLVTKISNVSEMLAFEELMNKSGLYLQEMIQSNEPVIKIYDICGKIFSFKQIEEVKQINIEHKKSLQQLIVDNLHHVSQQDKKSREKIELDEDILEFVHFLSDIFEIGIFGIDIIKSVDGNYYVIDINDFPGCRSVPGAGSIIGEYIVRENEINIAR